jgi:hypothetical protein
VPDVRRPATPDEELLGAERPAVVSERTEEERLEPIHTELVMGYEALADLGCAVSIFGSARTPPEHPDYVLARATAPRLGEAGFAGARSAAFPWCWRARRAAGHRLPAVDERALFDHARAGSAASASARSSADWKSRPSVCTWR